MLIGFAITVGNVLYHLWGDANSLYVGPDFGFGDGADHFVYERQSYSSIGLVLITLAVCFLPLVAWLCLRLRGMLLLGLMGLLMTGGASIGAAKLMLGHNTAIPSAVMVMFDWFWFIPMFATLIYVWVVGYNLYLRISERNLH